MTAADAFREYLVGSTFASAAASVTVTIPPRAMLWIEIAVVSFGTADVPALQFNGDTGNNYHSRYCSYAAASTTLTDTHTATTNMGRLALATNAKSQSYLISLTNGVSAAKVGTTLGFGGSGAAATTAALYFGGFEWVNTTAAITSIKLLGAGGFNFGVGSCIRVTGADFL